MAIRPFPPKAKDADPELDAKTEAFINKGLQASPPETPKAKTAEKTERKVLLTIPAESNSRIDALLKTRSVKIPRHTWLLEAIVEKLEREGK